MKFLDKLSLKIFSIIILLLSICTILVMTGILKVEMITTQVETYLNHDKGLIAIIVILAILMLLSIKELFFAGKSNDTTKEGIILENTSGKLVISKESLENLIASVVKEIPGADTVSSKTILDKNKNLIVYVTTVVSKDVMIKDISNELQEKVKLAMKKTADLDVKEVNIKIKNITSKKIRGTIPVNTDEEQNLQETSRENYNEEKDINVN